LASEETVHGVQHVEIVFLACHVLLSVGQKLPFWDKFYCSRSYSYSFRAPSCLERD